jgi:hypothetical protein
LKWYTALLKTNNIKQKEKLNMTKQQAIKKAIWEQENTDHDYDYYLEHNRQQIIYEQLLEIAKHESEIDLTNIYKERRV